MNTKAISIRPFVGSKNFKTSQSFYRELGFKESILGPIFSYFHKEKIGFYLQDAYVKDWIDNSMIFIEVDDVESCYEELLLLDLPNKFEGVRLIPTSILDWGKECFLHDPSGVLWHFGEFFDIK